MGVNFLGYDLFDASVERCALEIASVAASEQRECRLFACLNPHSYSLAKKDLSFRAALEAANWLVPDGAGVVYGARLLGLQISARVSGPDVFQATMERLDSSKGSVFFLGSSEDTLSKIRDRVAVAYPSIVVVGTFSPPYKEEFSEEENAAMIDAVNAAQPDVLWVGMTAPKQEKWIAANRSQLNVGVAGAIGAAFDFFAGTVKRSPRVFRALGLEWLPRLIQQPRRLWRRMFLSAPVFLKDVWRERRRRARSEKGVL